MKSARIIADIARYNEIYKFVYDEVMPLERSVQGIEEYMDVILKYFSSDIKKGIRFEINRF